VDPSFRWDGRGARHGNIFMKFTGIVKRGSGRGKALGFPTANIEAPENAGDGIYVGTVHCHTVAYDSVIFVGAAETFGEHERKAEVYILDFSEDLYGQAIQVEIVKKLRDNQKFESEQALIEQMQKDEQVAREFFRSPHSRG